MPGRVPAPRGRREAPRGGGAQGRWRPLQGRCRAGAGIRADARADWPTVADPGRTIAQPWAVLAPPQTYFIDRDGIVRDLQIGQVRDAAELDAILAAILK